MQHHSKMSRKQTLYLLRGPSPRLQRRGRGRKQRVIPESGGASSAMGSIASPVQLDVTLLFLLSTSPGKGQGDRQGTATHTHPPRPLGRAGEQVIPPEFGSWRPLSLTREGPGQVELTGADHSKAPSFIKVPPNPVTHLGKEPGAFQDKKGTRVDQSLLGDLLP